MNTETERVERSMTAAADKKVRDVMSAEVTTLERNDPVSLAAELIRSKGIRHFPVLQSGRLVGVISQLDVYHAALGSVMRYGEDTEKTFLSTISVKEILQDPVITISPEALLREAARLMAESKISCLPVVEERALVGIITDTDILKAVAQS